MQEKFLQQALNLAWVRRGFCVPNPSVGAVIVHNNEVIGSGYHFEPGQPHAEVAALQSLDNDVDLSNATMYVTLEPCCHTGRTPPCTQAIINSGIKTVFYGYGDPNPKVDGGGESQLSANGVRCEQIQMSVIDQFYCSYAFWIRTGLPWVTAKLAMSLDNVVASLDRRPLQITGVEAQRATHEHRLHSDALLTTAQTIISDDPQLNVRLSSEVQYKPIYIIDHSLRTPLTARVLAQPAHCTIFHAYGADNSELVARNIRCVELKSTDNHLDLSTVIQQIGQDGIHDLWVEAGPTLFNALVYQQLLNRALLYIAPKCFGTGLPAFESENTSLVSNSDISWYHYGSDGVCDITFKQK